MFKSEKLNELLGSAVPTTSYSSELFLDHFEIVSRFGQFDDYCYSVRMTEAQLVSWMCSDTLVGIMAYYLDSELVSISFQPARKSNCELYWVSSETREKMRAFIFSLYTPDINGQFNLIDGDVTDDVIQSYLNVEKEYGQSKR